MTGIRVVKPGGGLWNGAALRPWLVTLAAEREAAWPGTSYS
ncbi:hypothetical protein [Azospirillum lipoferum]|nr:hypothetical protein [Azospirillum lipoferum]